jgi:hypothetical protein
MSNPPFSLEPIKVADLEVMANPADLRRDLHVFVAYASEHEIKRGHRDNALPRPHQQRLARLMRGQELPSKDEAAWSVWLAHVDWLALELRFVNYDTKGVYAGYSSAEPSFPDNYVEVNADVYEKFVNRPLLAQEEAILEKHVSEKSNELFSKGPLTRSDPFDPFGSACGVVPTIPFPSVRRHLLALLDRCPIGVWLSAAALIEHLQLHDPWFLIPQKVSEQARTSTLREGRYGNFVERKRGDWGARDLISDRDPNGFAKVEGRYIERFLEGFPLVLGYVDVAYLKAQRESPIEPWRGLVRAFRVTERLARVMRKKIDSPKVTVLPNFEVHVESLFFAARTEAELQPFSEPVQRGIVTVYKLAKARVAASLAADSKRNPVARLEALSGQPVPANVRQELEEWVGHSDKFILYEGFGVLEGRRETAAIGAYIEEEIGPQFALVREPGKLSRELEEAEQVPTLIKHGASTLSAPAGIKTQLGVKPKEAAAPGRRPLKLKRSVQTTLWFTDAGAHEAYTKILLEAKCVVPIDRRALTVSYSAKNEAMIKEYLKELGRRYVVRIEELEG